MSLISYRAASGGAQEYYGIIPDMTSLGKIIGGGFSIGAFGGRKDIMDLYDPSAEGGPKVAHAGTFNANPMTMMAGEATLEQLDRDVFKRMNSLGDMLREKPRAVFGELDVQAQVTGIGSLFAIHFTAEEITDYRSMLRGDQEMKKRLFMGLINEGLLLFPNKCAGALSTLTTESEVDTLVDATRRVVQRTRG